MPVPQNVIWITTDHMRYDCIGAHGNEAMHTPNLDRLVNGGISFDNCFVQNPLCMPSRCSFMTGLYPQQTGITQNGQRLPADFSPTVAQVFKAGGYRTVQVGKLHFEPHEDMDLDPRPSNDFGFDVFCLAEEPGPYEDAYVKYLRNDWRELVDLFRVPRSCSPERVKELDGRVLDAPWQASFSGFVVEETCRLTRQCGRDFVHMGFYAPHPPLNPTREMFEPYRDAAIPLPPLHDEAGDKPEPLCGMLRQRRDWDEARFREYRRHFYAMVTGVDLAIGQLLEHLRASGRLEDTLIIFSSDHGDMCGDHGMILKQHSFYDQVMHVPLVMHWPAGFGTKPRRVGGLVEMVDLLPTLLELTGTRIPAVMAGRSYGQDLLAGREPAGREDVFAYHEPGHCMLRSATHKYIRYADGSEVLYDLADVESEVRNLADDPQHAQVLQQMRNRLLARLAETSRSRLPTHFGF